MLLLIFGERRRERGRQGWGGGEEREKQQLVPSHMCPDWGWNPQPFWCMGCCSDLARAPWWLLLKAAMKYFLKLPKHSVYYRKMTHCNCWPEVSGVSMALFWFRELTRWPAICSSLVFKYPWDPSAKANGMSAYPPQDECLLKIFWIGTFPHHKLLNNWQKKNKTTGYV